MKSLWKTSLSAVMLAGAVFASPAAAYVPKEVNLHKVEAGSSTTKSSLDLAIVNDEKLIESFIKRGLLSKDVSESDKQQFLKNYLTIKGKPAATKQADPLAAKAKAGEAKKQKKFKGFNNGLLNGKGEKNGHLKGNPDPVSESPNTKSVRKDKVLVLTVEYADFEHNKIKPDETDNYYKDYPLSHYEDMIFGKNGVKGPNGENLVSMKQFYEQQSGGTYTVDGKAYGWLKVPGTAAFYGADGKTGHDNVSPGGSSKLVKDTYDAAKAAGIPLQDYDLEDPHDLDGDGNLLEPDGLVDHLMIIHAGMGQEAGGGSLGDNAIWSHRSAVFYDPDGLGKGVPGFYDYTIMPEDGATGVFAHEYGHDLGLPDEYDTMYSGTGEAVAYWSIMASGSWAGKIPGAEPTGFSPFAKEYFQSYLGGNWSSDFPTIDMKDVSAKGTQFLLDQSNSPNGKNANMIKVNLPQKGMKINTPAAGNYEYWGGQKDESDTNMVTDVDLTGKSSATLTFDTWYDIEEQWDFAFVQVSTDGGATWKSLGNANTRSDVTSQGYPTILNSMPGFTGNSNGWQAQSFDLSDYKGQEIKLRLRYATDWASSQEGFYVDNIKVVADGKTIIEDGAEAASAFTLNGFTKSDGIKNGDHYYLLEWRNHAGVDKGLANIKRGNSLMSYDGGLVVWYVDPTYTDNWTGTHPGKGFLGVVDAHPATDLKWNVFGKDPVQASTRFHIADAAFGLNPTSGLNLIYPTQTLNLDSLERASLFDDSNSYLNPYMPDAGREIGKYGLKIRVNAQATDKSVGGIVIYK
ncbi:M6 family metalloprotease domain-containing protein [Neobacillus notoginsengisoli]|uniref:M6 family metalloprotease domain-containing protein n=1 Tax=Neobacillus notoginsengisoli TaxID=1578198 RepID=A0A417YYC8_9BACI|nr:immune inhibitor A domain-containing protein [Neobacillus notoginsengisoli]RHW42714.1 M6 family metalloprotease domain-containing protein [Neobacillus notoginsengisoli]